MKYEKQEVLQYVAEEDVKFIRLAFCDVFGKPKNISVMPCELERAFAAGVPVDSSEIDGFGGAGGCDVYLHPDPDTLTVLPWRPEHGRVVRMFCTVSDENGKELENDPRTVLKNAVAAAKEKGYTFLFASEAEFYLFCRDENGDPTDIPYDNAGYMDIAPEDKGENVRREICLTLEQMGIVPKSSCHKAGPGQNQIAFRRAEALNAADNAVSFETAVKVVAARNGLYADFSPKPIENKPGNGFFVNMSVCRNDGGEVPLSQMLAGILEKAADMSVFMNPTPDSYRRLDGEKMSRLASYSEKNRSRMMRIYTDDKGNALRAQIRTPDSSANPYIVMALLIYAALYGAENNLKLPAAQAEGTEGADVGDVGNGAKSPTRPRPLPKTAADAAKAARESEFVSECLPESLTKAYCEAHNRQTR